MRNTVPVLAVSLFAFLAGSAPAPTQTPNPAKSYSPGVAEIMIMTQIRHAKLWFAGDARNWELADYQIDELKEGLEDLITYFPVYKDIPVGRMTEATAMPAIADVEAAIKAKDRTKFGNAFDKLTAACNTCHQSANRPFIVVQRPATSPFSNQLFAPKR